ncbi:MAG: DNA polymerase III subunit delta' [Chloroflexi bacterium]|nr:DNA polymerase III subunit delta' [Chloroflexota bacterium]
MNIGHEWVIDFIRRVLAEGRAHHAYLLTGPTHVGKLTTALAMAQVLLCEKQTGCGQCRHCQLVGRRIHPDLRILELPADRRTIPIRDVHEFTQGIALKPLEAERKVYIIDSADLLSEDGANALLKTIEEPPPAVTLLLTATDPARLLPTVVSRCHRLSLRRVPAEVIQEHLTANLAVDASQARTIAELSHGLPGWAILAQQQPEIQDEQRQRGRDLAELLQSSRLDRLKYADTLADRWSGHNEQVLDVLEIWIDAWRGLALSKAGLTGQWQNLDLTSGQSLDLADVRTALAATLDTLEALKANAHPRLALESLLLLWPRLPIQPLPALPSR